MKIRRIQITDFQILKHVEIPVNAPALLICGPNSQGKSSIGDAIRLALTGESTRVEHKKDWSKLVRVGAPKGAKIVLEGDDWSAALTLPSGSQKGAPPVTESLYSALDPTWFTNLKADARRAFLFELMNINGEPDEIIRRIEARGADSEKLKRVAPLIGKGTWESIAEECKKRATKLKGRWEEVTGEAWGEKKAEGWIPTISARPDGTAVGVQHQIDEVDLEIAGMNQKLGAADAYAKSAADLTRRIAEQSEIGRLHARRTSALHAAEGNLAEARERLAAAQEKASGGTVAQHWPCPGCGSLLMHRMADGTLVPFEPPSQIADPQWKAALPSLQEAVTFMETAVANAARDVRTSDNAAAQKAALEDQLDALPKDAASVDIALIRERISERQDYRRSLVKQQDQIREVETAIAGAAKQRDAAAEHHRDTMQWLEIAELIGPSGIPGDLLSEGLTPFNAKLAELAGIAGWDAPSIANDMSIAVSGLPLGLASESARYRCVALIALAIAVLSGTKFVMLDGAEILVGPQRSALIRLIHQLAGSGAIETAVVMMTLKEPPARLPANWSHVWVEAGEIVRDEAEKVAA